MKKNILMMLGICFICLACQTEQIENSDKRRLESNSRADDSCETSFAIGNSDDDHACFSDAGFSRWGWNIGPLLPGTYTYDVYAGAGQCDITKGQFVGTVTISYDGTHVTALYDLTNEYSHSETHLYAGTSPFPTKNNGRYTVAPGQYSVQDELNGEAIYVIAHAVTCEDEDDSGSGPY
jgi:hypothetical protein